MPIVGVIHQGPAFDLDDPTASFRRLADRLLAQRRADEPTEDELLERMQHATARNDGNREEELDAALAKLREEMP